MLIYGFALSEIDMLLLVFFYLFIESRSKLLTVAYGAACLLRFVYLWYLYTLVNIGDLYTLVSNFLHNDE